MNPKLSFLFRAGIVIWMGYIGIMATLDLIFPEELGEVEYCADFDDLLNYCNEYAMREVGGKPIWLNVMFIAMSIFIIMIYVPMLKTEYKKLRYGYRSTWDDEFKK